jgi:hypothetical protein
MATPSLFRPSTPRVRQLLSFLGLPHKLEVRPIVVVSIGPELEKLRQNGINGILFRLVECPANTKQGF